MKESIEYDFDFDIDEGSADERYVLLRISYKSLFSWFTFAVSIKEIEELKNTLNSAIEYLEKHPEVMKDNDE